MTGPEQPGTAGERSGARLGLLRAMAIVAVVVLLGLGAMVYVSYQMLHEPSTVDASVDVPRGASLRETCRILERARVVDWPVTLELYARWSGRAGTLKAGHYELHGSLSPVQVLDLLTKGVPGGDVEVTFPEGSDRWDVASGLERAGVCPAARFLDVAGPEVEGYLFPDTYRFFPDTRPEEVVRAMRERFERVWRDLAHGHPEALARAEAEGFGRRELVIVASLVEREAKVPDERPIIARVIFNRLAKGWKLQVDATCVYGPTTHRVAPTPALCKDPSNRYSTYVHQGLPPGAICNPGRSSLEAALEPARGTGMDELMFYVARRDGTGRHDFSKTAKEHGRKVREYLGPRRGKPGGRR